MIQKNLEDLKLFLESPKSIVFIGHRNPDGDTMGACLGLATYFSKKGHQTTVIMPNECPEFLTWLPREDTTLYLFDKQNHQSKRAIKSSDIIFLLDFNALHRVGDNMESFLKSYDNDFALIDHHQQPYDVKYMFSDTAMSSTCQMVYHFIEKVGDIDLIDESIATCLYTGIMTDTGSFRFSSTTSLTHKVVAELIDKGAKNDLIHSKIYDSNSYGRLQLLGQALKNLRVYPEFRTALITITEKDKKQNYFKKGDTEGIVNYALSLENIVFGVIFIEDKEQGIIKISFRSKGDFSVNQFSRKYFNGGGHDNAAGGKSDLTMEETLKKFISLLPQYKQELQSSYE